MTPTLRALLVCLFLAFLMACDAGPRIEDVRALHAEGRFEDSLEPLRTLLESSPDDPEVNLLYGRALNRTTSSPIAVSWFALTVAIFLRSALSCPGGTIATR